MMRMRVRHAGACALLAASGCCAGCDDHDKLAAAGKASASGAAALASARADAPDAPPPPPGCVRSGALEGVENEPACVLGRVPPDAMRDATSRLALSLELERDTVMSGAAAVMRVVITNRSSAETLVVLEAYTRAAGPRPDWSRLSGVPDVKGDLPQSPKLQFGIHTLDARDRSVDAVPMVANSAGATASARLVGVRLKPGARLTHSLPWWALQIPAPAPVFKDDAGHRWVPKTAPVPLWPGDYTIAVEIPLHRLEPAERTVTTRVHVEKSTAPKVPKTVH